jgi:hypothetical protein
MTEQTRDSPNVNEFCALSANKVYGPFLITDQTITGTAYLDMIELWFMPQLEEDHGNKFFFQQDSALSHFHCNVTNF